MKKAIFSIPSTFSQGEIEAALTLNKRYAARGSVIDSFYGNLNPNKWPSGRYACDLPSVKLKSLKKYIRSLHVNGFKFEYTLNAPYLGDIEYTSRLSRLLLDHVKKLSGIGIDHLCLSNFVLIGMVFSKIPHLKINVSTIADIKKASQIKQLEPFNVDTITLSCDINRDLASLSEIVAASKEQSIKIKLLANNTCMDHCLFSRAHYDLISRFNSKKSKKDTFQDYFSYFCLLEKIKNPVEIIKTPFIRPEDIHHYRKLGIEFFKISGRVREEAVNFKNIEAYMKGSFYGNFFELWSGQQTLMWPKLFYLDNARLNGLLGSCGNPVAYKKKLQEITRHICVNKALRKQLHERFITILKKYILPNQNILRK